MKASPPLRGLDAHAMDPGAVFASLNALGGTPPYTIVIGCEVANIDDGIGSVRRGRERRTRRGAGGRGRAGDLLARTSVGEG